ncbi:hypothetical protein F9U64_20325 [Gracilibacillus oryzae]|uniref:Uncharacterized protein n=1 Tax=Gracilibacillus oryzae TaxID=1672701 RepID=A0A7C8KML6_9BACI|nr:hypothetical protein [Gracilibacillus oryzae]KAB8126250.1 hypothetical protein F9U64_20325 [Gracilibacillus oryzae]
MSNSEISKTSAKIIDMLVGSTLKKHNAQIDSQQLSAEEKAQIKSLVEELKQSVESLKTKSADDSEK